MVIVVVGVVLQISHQLEILSNNTIKVEVHTSLYQVGCVMLSFILKLHFHKMVSRSFKAYSSQVCQAYCISLTIRFTSSPTLEMSNLWHEMVC